MSMPTHKPTKADTFDREILTTRMFDASRERVWKAWTDPEQMVKWWGPNGFTTTLHEMDIRPGGVWSFIMHGPDGADYKNKSVFVEVVKPERIVYDHISGPKFRMTTAFDGQDGKTKLTMRMVFETPAAYKNTVEKFNAIEGARQTLERLAAHLGVH
jgi:uncharacterized protein YndB with AHSA1/START domain